MPGTYDDRFAILESQSGARGLDQALSSFDLLLGIPTSNCLTERTKETFGLICPEATRLGPFTEQRDPTEVTSLFPFVR